MPYKKKILLASIMASHYRSLIYQLMDRELHCDFVFGKDNSTVKTLDLTKLSHTVTLPNRHLGGSNFYYQPSFSGIAKKYDVVINDLGVFCISAWWLLLRAKARKQKVYHWDHGWYGRESLVKKVLKRMYFALADGAFIYGQYACDLMKKNGFNAGKLHVIHNSLDYDRQLELRKAIVPSSLYKEHFGNANPVLCFIGRLTSVKRIDYIVRALHIMKQQGTMCNLIIIGDGEERANIETLAETLDVKGHVWMYGPCYDEAVNAKLIYNADLCVSPGNVGLTAMHAMMFGCPVITHSDFKWQMPEFEAITDGSTGTFFRRDDVNDMATSIAAWLKSHRDGREEVREACFKEIDKNWNPHKQLEVIKRVIYE